MTSLPKSGETARQFNAETLVIATHNAGKLREIKEYFKDMNVALTSAGELNLPEPDETEDTYIGNATIKALAAAKASGKVALSDDSGLAIEALGGSPGVYSADWAEEEGENGKRDFYAAMDRIKREIGDNPNRKAKFVCALVMAWPDGHTEAVEGYVHGHVEFPPRGDKGFGYDPIFVPEGDTRTFGEMEYAEKEPISHRNDAIGKLLAKCFR